MKLHINSHTLRYSFMVFPVAFAGIPIYIFLPDYYHNHFGLSLTVLSITLFMLRVIDAVFDPLIGFYCDRFPKLQKKTFISIIMVFIAGFYILCNPVLSSKLINLSIGVFLSTIAFSYLTIFINTQGALWKKQEKDKALIISMRESFNILGILFASIMPFVLMSFFSVNTSYFIYSVIFIVIILLSSRQFLQWHQSIHTSKSHSSLHAVIGYRTYISKMNRHGICLFLSYSISAFGSAIPAVMLAFYSRYVLQMPEYTGVYLFLYFLGAIFAIPVVKKLSLQYGAIAVWQYAIMMAIAIFICAFFLHQGDIFLFSLISFGSGLCFSAELILPNLLLAKWIDVDSRRKLGNGYYALLSFIGKLSFALATIATLPWLDNSIAMSNISVSTILLIKGLYCGLPCVVKTLALVSLFVWQIRLGTGEVN